MGDWNKGREGEGEGEIQKLNSRRERRGGGLFGTQE